MSERRIAYLNGKVYMGNGAFAEAFLTEGERFLKTGSNEEIASLSADETVDLEGRFVSPGFNDSHMHLLNYGVVLSNLSLSEHTGSLRDLMETVKREIGRGVYHRGKWLIGRGWNQDYFSDEKRMVRRDDLDAISDSVPILLVRSCGHAASVNSAVLRIANITKDTKDPEGGTIGRREDGEPDGILYENAIELLNAVKPLPDKGDIKEMLVKAMREANRYGITSVQTDDYSTFRSVPYRTINEAYEELKAEGKLTVRVTEQCNFASLSDFRRFLKDGNLTGRGDTLFRLGPLKLIGDGSLGSRTAHLSRPYLGTDQAGFSLFSPEELKAIIRCANDAGMQVAVHAIGDRCLDEVLDAYEEALRSTPRADHRHGVVHCQISRKDQLERIAALHLHVYAQTIFLDYDNHIVEAIVPPEVTEYSYSFRTLMQLGVTVSNGSDCPVELPDVASGIECGVTRRSKDGTGPFLPREALTVREALDSYTESGAKASFEEQIKGRIQAGMLADFVVLDRDPFSIPAEELHTLRVIKTVLGGKCVFTSKV